MTDPKLKSSIQWFVRCEGIAKMGPFVNQAEAIQAVMTLDGIPAQGALAWPEQRTR